MSDISDEDYQHAQRVWKVFDMKNLGEHHDLYLKTDVILLSNVFEAFRSTCLKHYSLDLAHFFTSLGLAWQACLKKTGIRLELLTDPNMLLMFERGIRGGITQAVLRYAKVNNKYTGEKFDPDEDNSFLQYLDANSLYGWVMSQLLPTGRFNGVDPSQFKPNKIDSYSNCDEEGYLLEVDVKYPKELHDWHNDLPFMCEKMVINKVVKLVLNLYDKRNYIVHLRALNQAIKHGLILEKFHRVFEFNQSFNCL